MAFMIALLGLILGPAINYAIYQFAYFPRPISPWQRTPDLPVRPLFQKVPVLGWLARTSESDKHGWLFWLRPMLIELSVPIALWWMFSYIMAGELLPLGVPPASDYVLFQSFVCVALLTLLLTVATFIDFDERTIPDIITVPGTCFAIIMSAAFPDWRLKVLDQTVGPTVAMVDLHANSPSLWPASWIQGGGLSLFLAVFFWLGWCFALLNRVWITRRGWKKAWNYFWAYLARDPWTARVIVMAMVGTVGIIASYYSLTSARWESMLSSLFGIGLGGLLVWSFRIVAAVVLKKEALGFGDVTLMAMVGAFTGWQVVWISFFLSPFFGLIFVIGFWLVTRDTSTPFGPYLSLGVVYTLYNWANIWTSVTDSEIILPPSMLIVFWGILLIALALLLGVIEFVKMSVGKRFLNDK
jgi:prepilin signal peptidase PulO-like enzyme (type II secretory pathway)